MPATVNIKRKEGGKNTFVSMCVCVCFRGITEEEEVGRQRL